MNFFHIIKDGTYFNPSYKHYGEHQIDVFCNRCSIKTLFCIGMGENYDLCFNCVNELQENIKYSEIFTSGILFCNMISYVSNITCDKCRTTNVKIYISHNDISLCSICVEKIMHKSSLITKQHPNTTEKIYARQPESQKITSDIFKSFECRYHAPSIPQTQLPPPKISPYYYSKIHFGGFDTLPIPSISQTDQTQSPLPKILPYDFSGSSFGGVGVSGRPFAGFGGFPIPSISQTDQTQSPLPKILPYDFSGNSFGGFGVSGKPFAGFDSIQKTKPSELSQVVNQPSQLEINQLKKI